MSSERKRVLHAPGPWTLGEVRLPNTIYGQATTAITGADDSLVATLRASGPIFEANARLIAKAPEMLARVRARLAGCTCTEGWAKANKRAQCGDCDEDQRLIAEIEGGG